MYINTLDFLFDHSKSYSYDNKLQMQESCIMKKRFLVAAMAATLVSPLAAQADATVYGNVHLSLDTPSYENNEIDSAGDPVVLNDNMRMNSNTSAIGVKGKEDLGGGMSAIFKVEFQVDPSERNNANNNSAPALLDRDQWVGLKGAMGTIKFGTMSNNYKQMGGKIDPMYRTRLEGRGMMNTQSQLHSGAGENGGRSTNTLQYSSPKMGGMQMVFNYTISGRDDETMGLGLRYKTKAILAYVDYLDVQGGSGNTTVPSTPAGSSEAAFKVGGSFKTGGMTFGLQYESVESAICAINNCNGSAPGDTIFASFNMKVSDAGYVAVTLGDNGMADMGYALMYNHKLSKRTNTYIGYGDNASNSGPSYTAGGATVVNADAGNDRDQQLMTLGIRHKF